MNLFKKISPSAIRTRSITSRMKRELVNNFFDSVSDMLVNSLFSFPECAKKKNYAELKNGKIVEKVHITRDEEEEAQDQIFADIMSKMNGDRDILYDVPDEIEIQAFEDDDMDPEDRELIQDTIDAINETNDIRREGKFRTKESMEKSVKEHNDRIKEEQQKEQADQWKSVLKHYAKPIVSIAILFLGTSMGLVMIDKFGSIISKL